MADSKAERVEIGFSGGQAISVRLEESKLKDLRKALEGKDRWADLDTRDGVVTVDLAQIVFISTSVGPGAIGFGG